MRALTNPYTPNAGAEPVALVGRDDQLNSFDLLLVGGHAPEYADPGSGLRQDFRLDFWAAASPQSPAQVPQAER